MWQAIGYASTRTGRVVAGAAVARTGMIGTTGRLAALGRRRGFLTGRVIFARTATKTKKTASVSSDANKLNKAKAKKIRKAPATTAAPGTAAVAAKKSSPQKDEEQEISAEERERKRKAMLAKRKKRESERMRRQRARERLRRQREEKALLKKKKKERAAQLKANKPEMKRRRILQKLREVSLLEEEPKPETYNTWNLYVQMHTKGKSSLNPEEFSGLIKELRESYLALPETERKRLRETAEKNRAAHMETYQAWVKSKMPAEVERANVARAQLENKFNVKFAYRTRTIKDERIPKKPTSAYNHFFISRYASAYRGVNPVEAGRAIAKDWHSLTEAEKATYTAEAQADKKRYAEAVQSVLGRSGGGKRKVLASILA